MTPHPILTVNTHFDGYVLRFDGQQVDVFPTLSAASVARHTARDAIAMLAECLAAAPSNTNRKAA